MSPLSALAPAHLPVHLMDDRQAAVTQRLLWAMFALTLRRVVVEFAIPMHVGDDALDRPSQDDGEAFRSTGLDSKDLWLLGCLRLDAIGWMVFLIPLGLPDCTAVQPSGGSRPVNERLSGSTVNALRPETHPRAFVGLRWTPGHLFWQESSHE